MPRADRLATARAARDGARAPGHGRLGCLREGELPLAAPAADLHCHVRLPVRDPCPRHLTRLRKRNGPVDRAVARRSRLAWQPPDAHHLAGEPLPDPGQTVPAHEEAAIPLHFQRDRRPREASAAIPPAHLTAHLTAQTSIGNQMLTDAVLPGRSADGSTVGAAAV
jgi:hypothetical protein